MLCRHVAATVFAATSCAMPLRDAALPAKHADDYAYAFRRGSFFRRALPPFFFFLLSLLVSLIIVSSLMPAFAMPDFSPPLLLVYAMLPLHTLR